MVKCLQGKVGLGSWIVLFGKDSAVVLGGKGSAVVLGEIGGFGFGFGFGLGVWIMDRVRWVIVGYRVESGSIINGSKKVQ